MNENLRPDYPEYIDQKLIDRAENLGTALLCDGMKGLDILQDGCMAPHIKPVDKNMRVVGTAVTIETTDGDNLPIHFMTYSCKPGYVMVIDGKNYSARAYIGDLIIGAAQAVGFKGIVIDGYSRDRLGTTQLGLPVFSSGFLPRGPVKQNLGGINQSISCGGVTVQPGDLVVGDADGVVVVPREHIIQVIENAEVKLRYERERRCLIAEYASAKAKNEGLPNLTPKWVSEMLAHEHIN